MYDFPSLADFFQLLFYGFMLFIGTKLVWFISRKVREIQDLKRLAKSDIRYIDQMDGYQFELYLKALFKELGYRPEITKKAGDFGADVILKGRNRIVIQAKRYGIKNKVGVSAVQEIYAAQAYYRANEAWAITNSLFTKQAEELAKACNVKLLDRFELQKFINKVNPENTAQNVYNNIAPANRTCPKCGNDLVIRVSKQNENKFFGCTTYPSCRYTEPINK